MKNNRYAIIASLQMLGIAAHHAAEIRRIAMTLHRWHELECGTDHGGIERDETTGRPYWYNAMTGKRSKFPIRDMETGALKRLHRIMSTFYPDLAAYVQGDPRGCSLYIYRKDNPRLADYDIESVYSSIGTPVYR